MTSRQITETQEVINVTNPAPRKIVKTTTIVPDVVDQSDPQKTFNTKKAIFRTYQVLFYVLGIIELLLVFRLLLKLIGANPNSGFTLFVYVFSNPFATPFLGVVRSTIVGNTIMEWSTLIAMAVYAVIVWLIIEFFQIVKPVKQTEIEQTVDNI